MLEYSVAPIKFPYQYAELVLAIDYVKKNDIGNKVVILGFSAGGHLVGMGATLHNKEFAGKYFESLLDSQHLQLFKKPDVAVMCYPVVSARFNLKHRLSFKNLCQNDRALKKLLSLESQVDYDTSDCFIWHTKRDRGVSYKNSQIFYNALQKYSVKSQLLLFDNGGHGLSMGNENYPEIKSWVEKCVEFIKKSDC